MDISLRRVVELTAAGIGTGKTFETDPAHLTSVVVKLLDPSRPLRISYNAQHGGFVPWSSRGRIQSLCVSWPMRCSPKDYCIVPNMLHESGNKFEQGVGDI
jgi:hypothetical protein